MTSPHFGYQPCRFCGKTISGNGGGVKSHYRKHVREGLVVETKTSEGFSRFNLATAAPSSAVKSLTTIKK